MGMIISKMAFVNLKSVHGEQLQRLDYKNRLGEHIDLRDLEDISFKPDAFIIDPAQKKVVLFEIEDTSKIKDDKMINLAYHWFMMDAEGWAVELICVDRYGNNPSTVDLQEAYYVFMYDELGKEFPA